MRIELTVEKADLQDGKVLDEIEADLFWMLNELLKKESVKAYFLNPTRFVDLFEDYITSINGI